MYSCDKKSRKHLSIDDSITKLPNDLIYLLIRIINVCVMSKITHVCLNITLLVWYVLISILHASKISITYLCWKREKNRDHLTISDVPYCNYVKNAIEWFILCWYYKGKPLHLKFICLIQRVYSSYSYNSAEVQNWLKNKEYRLLWNTTRERIMTLNNFEEKFLVLEKDSWF